MSRVGKGWVVVLGAALGSWPSVCAACAVCNDPKNTESQAAFLNMTIFMSLFPLALIGGMGLWLRRRMKALEAQEAALQAAALGPSADDRP